VLWYQPGEHALVPAWRMCSWHHGGARQPSGPPAPAAVARLGICLDLPGHLGLSAEGWWSGHAPL